MKSLTNKFLIIGLAAGAMLTVAVTPSKAVLIAYDGFATTGAPNYTAGTSINGVNGGAGFTGAWPAGGFDAQNGGLTFGSLATTSGQATIVSNFGFNASTRGIPSTSSGDLWVSWLWSPVDPADSNTYSGFGLTAQFGGADLFYVGDDGAAADTYNVAIRDSGQVSYSPLVSGQTYFTVVHINFGTFANDGSVDVYLNPTPGGALGAPLRSVSGLNLPATNGLVMLGYGNGATAFDEIRFGTTYAEVSAIPEPSTFLLLGAAGLVMVIRRKRRIAA